MTQELHPRRRVRPDMKSIAREHGFLPLRVEGKLPSELEGTLVRTGPGLYESFGQRIGHSFEADGALCGVRLSGGAAAGAVRLVESEGFRAERRAGKALFGPRAPRLRRIYNSLTRRTKNTGNTAMLGWQHRLFALVESNKPMEISPADLSSLGETDLGGAITASFSAHPHAVNARSAIYNFGIDYGPKSHLVLYELPFRGAARTIGRVALRAPVMLHDFAVTERHAIFFVSPARIRILRALAGAKFSSILAWEPDEGTEILVVPLDRPEDVVRWTVPAFWQWHFAGAWEREREIVVHYARYPNFDTFEELRGEGVETPATLHRAVLDPAARTMKTEVLWDGALEFPEIDPRREGARYGVVYGTSESGGRRALARIDVETGKARLCVLDEGVLASEVVFVPRDASAEEGDGYGLSLLYDSRTDTSHLAVIDTARWEHGPIARCHFETHVPLTFHGTWLARGS